MKIIQDVVQGAAQLKRTKDLMLDLGGAMTDAQTEALSAVIDADDGSFQRWLKTDEGRQATRAYADAFLMSLK